ncbi:Bax inhibitor-1/YccA family protein [Novosphingobium mangrovi (ex Huang et al. 2023)]|uniref:Bax inhibitor-1/YccA family protein n=1 Tax=Novosphingobium mangrovi (ex Huang et al. 2023) TaxID=2976432 RepID=A0ABT2I5X9_9SPHN|nr:Bax inhibitor-1/YccA family protein [Novosphingobium mangrovi (ex Huang et al. 2023)]MCT2400211.1 Bax inhibitor-1/YccA family protein [Novosphingobium mangrovi (ex Huang et al. 2023)]
MANWNDPQPRSGFGASPSLDGRAAGRASYDMGLRRHMLSIYNYMASGVLLSGIVALLFANSGMAAQMIYSPLKWLVMLAPLGFVFAISGGANRFQESTLKMLYWGFCVVMGLSLSTIFLVFTQASIATTFFATAAAFAGLSLYGYTTKKDLSGFGTFLIMGVVGILVAMLINLFVQSTVLQLVVSILGVLIFAGLTAYDTQMLKNQYYHLRGTEFVGKAVVLGALSLYLDFINMFQFLLSFLGQRN